MLFVAWIFRESWSSMLGNSTSSGFILDKLLDCDSRPSKLNAYCLTLHHAYAIYFFCTGLLCLYCNVYYTYIHLTWSPHPHKHTHEGPCRHGAQCLFAQSHDPIGFAEPSESYIFVWDKSIIELGALHLVTVNELLPHTRSLSRSDSKLYTYAP